MGKATERFMAKVSSEPMSGCWLWAAYCKKTPSPTYMQPWFTYKGKAQSGARVAWTLFKGQIHEESHVLHTCDNCYCVNPAHLYLGDHSINMQDMIHRDRGANSYTKISKEQIMQAKKLRSQGRTVVSIAKDYGIHMKSMSRILNKKLRVGTTDERGGQIG